MIRKAKARKKARHRRPWWRTPRFRRRLIGATVTLVVIGLFGLLAVYVGGRGPEEEPVGQQLSAAAPPFTLPTVDEGVFSSADHVGQHALLLFINEGMGCAPCFDQIVDLEEDWKRFEDLNVQLVSIMVDPKEALAAEVEDRGITTVVAVDEDRKVSESYDAMEASMHPGVKPGHTFVLVDETGQMIWRVDWWGAEMAGGRMYLDVDQVHKGVSDALARVIDEGAGT